MKTKFWDYQFVATELDQLPWYIDKHRSCTNNNVHLVNTHMLSEAENNQDLRLILREAKFNLMDGMPIVQLKRWQDRRRYDRLAGVDVFWKMMDFASEHHRSVLLLGGETKDLKAAKIKLSNLYPDLKMSTLDPGWIDLCSFDPSKLIEQCSSFDFVMVFLGCPKQELVMSRLARYTSTCYFGLGGVLELIIGKKRRAPLIIRRLSLEWLFRLLQDPVRLMRRYGYHNTNFIIRHFIRMKR